VIGASFPGGLGAELPGWLLQLVRVEKETRWFRRHLLRRRSRTVLIAAQVPTDFAFTRSLGGPDALSCTVTGRDALELLELHEGRQ
jgi:hypothetical protein